MLNTITIMGRLVKDPELRTTTTEKAVVNFCVAVERDVGEATDFIDCVAWDRTAEFIDRYFKKGSSVIIRGALRQRSWEDREGKKRNSYEVVAEKVYFGERNGRSQVD